MRSVEWVRRTNLSRVLRLLHAAGPQSRSQLSARLNLTRSTTGHLVADLTSRGLVYEGSPKHAGTPGRPSPVVYPRPDMLLAVAAEIAVDSLAVALVGLGGRIHSVVRVARDPDRLGAPETVEDLARLLHRELAHRPQQAAILGVGIAFYGVVRRQDGFVHHAPNLGWRDVPLGALLQRSLGVDVPIIVANDADLGALAEHVRGAGVGLEHLVYLSSEVGVGGGVIASGQPLEGVAGCAGEVGHLPINPYGLPCRCGAVGCWETEVGELALLRYAGRDAGPSRQEAVASLLADASCGEPSALRAVEAVGHWLGVGIAGLVNMFNPQRIIVGGFFADLYPLVRAQVLERVRTRAMAPARDQVDITIALLGAHAPLLGAAELVFAAVLADPSLVPPHSQAKDA